MGDVDPLIEDGIGEKETVEEEEEEVEEEDEK